MSRGSNHCVVVKSMKRSLYNNRKTTFFFSIQENTKDNSLFELRTCSFSEAIKCKDFDYRHDLL